MMMNSLIASRTECLIPSKLKSSSELVDKNDVFVFDCDGVIWKGETLIPGAAQALEKLRANGKSLFFITNNSTKSREGFRSKFIRLGLNVHIDEIFSSSFAAALYLQQNPLPPHKNKVYVVGQEGIEQELDLVGISHFGGPNDAGKTVNVGDPNAKIEIESNVGAVVVGLDTTINYYKIQYAQLCINSGSLFIATNMDQTGHLTRHQEWAGGGAMVGALKGCTGQDPIVCGKPSSLLIDYVVDRYGFRRDRICMVGDRLDTDVLFGCQNGLRTLLVLSGVTDEAKLFSDDNDIHPDFFCDSIADLI
jgi:phosphoglycolate phosphatase